MKSSRTRVLLVHPHRGDLGGVASYYRILEPFSAVDASHFINGRRPDEKSAHFSFGRLVGDYVRFIVLLLRERFDVININPSLNRKGVLRDSVFIIIAKHLLRHKTVVFFHGWEHPFVDKLKGWKLRLFHMVYAKADATIVLAKASKQILLDWGFSPDSVIVETTAFDESLSAGFDLERAIAVRQKGPFYVLFFARLIKEKGLYESLETFALLNKKYPSMQLLIAGDGEEFNNVKSFLDTSKLVGVEMLGYIKSREKVDLLTKSALFFLPSYTEGLPISLLEAMAMGLPIVTRSIGGIKDFFEQRKHGFATESLQPEVFAEFIGELFERRDLYEEISRYNYQYAKDHFSGSRVRQRMEGIYLTVGGK